MLSIILEAEILVVISNRTNVSFISDSRSRTHTLHVQDITGFHSLPIIPQIL